MISIFLFQPTFFGLHEEYSEEGYNQLFYLKHYGGWSFIEAYNLPIGLRDWFTKRLIKQLEDEKEAIEKAQNGGSSGSTELTANNSPQMPKQLKRMIGPTLKLPLAILRYEVFMHC